MHAHTHTDIHACTLTHIYTHTNNPKIPPISTSIAIFPYFDKIVTYRQTDRPTGQLTNGLTHHLIGLFEDKQTYKFRPLTNDATASFKNIYALANTSSQAW